MISSKSIIPFLILILSLQRIHQTDVAASMLPNSTNCTTDDHLNTSSSTKSFGVKLSVFTITSVGTVFNALLITVIIIDPLRILRKGPWITIINLAFADLLSCVSFAAIFNPTSWAPLESICSLVAVNIAIVTGQSASFFLLTVFTVEIYIIIKFPLRRKFILTRRRVLLACVSTWLLAFGLGLLSFYTNLFDESVNGIISQTIWIAWIGLLELSVAIQLVFKVRVITEIIKNRRRAFTTNENIGKRNNIAKAVMFLNIILLTTAFPYWVGKQLEYLARLNIIRDFDRAIIYYYTPIATINYVVNPFLYAWRLPDYRRTLVACFTKEIRRRNSSRLGSTPQKSTSV